VFVFLGDNLYNDVSSTGGLCDPSDCEGFAKTLWGACLVTLHKLLFNCPWTPAWAKRTGEDFMAAHNLGESAAADVAALAANYQRLGVKPEFKALQAAVPEIVAT
jgi:hypothetical protein